ncbi:hypothetical protein ADK84_16095, partial [Streptomyces sp. NRRL WC-3701]
GGPSGAAGAGGSAASGPLGVLPHRTGAASGNRTVGQAVGVPFVCGAAVAADEDGFAGQRGLGSDLGGGFFGEGLGDFSNPQVTVAPRCPFFYRGDGAPGPPPLIG